MHHFSLLHRYVAQLLHRCVSHYFVDVPLDWLIDTLLNHIADIADSFNVCRTYHGTAAEEAVG
jgi:hypothetical protein